MMRLKPLLAGSVIYHCGPVVAGLDTKQYKFVAAGPTTSIREEPYQGMVMKHFNIKGVIGKGGMGPKTSGRMPGCARCLSACHWWRSLADRPDGGASFKRLQA